MINERYLCLDDLEGELWKDIKGFEDLYQVSTYSGVKSKKREHCNNQFGDERILKPYKNKKGYYQIDLHKDGKRYLYKLHTLVAEAFISKKTFKSIPNENRDEIDLDKLEINHKDENPSNNCVDNLEWCTHLYNCNYGTRIKRIKEKQEIKINQYSLDGIYLRTWDSISEIKRVMNYNISNISCTCRNDNRLGYAYGYLWKKHNGDIDNIQSYNPKMLNKYTRELIKNELEI